MRAYEGNEPYIFMSYAHKDSAEVFRLMEQLKQRGYRIWYDDGIEPGSEWPENIAQHLLKAHVFITCISENSMESMNCRREINYALSKNKPFLSIYLERTNVPPGMELQISAQQSILKYNYNDEKRFLDKIESCSYLSPCKFLFKVPRSHTHVRNGGAHSTSTEPERFKEPIPQVPVNNVRSYPRNTEPEELKKTIPLPPVNNIRTYPNNTKLERYNVPIPQQPAYNVNTNQRNSEPQEYDMISILCAVICFLFPFVGLILYFVWRNSKPKAAKLVLISSLISIIIVALSYMLGALSSL